MEGKKAISPFEFAIMQISDPEKSENFRPETKLEKIDRIEKDFNKTASQLKVSTELKEIKGMKQEVYIIDAGHRLDVELLKQEHEVKYNKEISGQKKFRKKNNRKKAKRR